MNSHLQRTSRHRSRFLRKSLASAIIGCIAFQASVAVRAQAINGTIRGTVPVAKNEAIRITGGAGFNRTIPVGPSGNYSVTLPVGTYTVSLLQNGAVVQTRAEVSPVAAGSVTVNFTSSVLHPQTMTAITVSATAVPAIDVNTTNQVSTITAEQLQQLPLLRSGEAIALLAPGVSSGAVTLGSGPTGNPLLSFNGASVAENAYYLDGMNTTDLLTGQGGITLPYGAILQQQTLTTGYGAKYGRSIGGVINQIGKSGSNEWHFGARAEWEPSALRSNVVNQYYNNPRITSGPHAKGQLRTLNTFDNTWTTVYDAHVGGPIITNKLFFFVAAEADKTHFNDVAAIDVGQNFVAQQKSPKLYAKISWNITDNNFFSLTLNQDKFDSHGSTYLYDNDTHTTGAFLSKGQVSRNTFRTWVANYTSYLTDNLTLQVMFGKTHARYKTSQPAYPGFDPTLPHVGGTQFQNPALLPLTGPVTNSQTRSNMDNPGHRGVNMAYRISLDYKWRHHDFTIGVDNIQTWDIDEGSLMTGPGYAWFYAKGDPATPIIGTNPNIAPYAGPPNSNPAGANGYYVTQDYFANFMTVRVKQYAYYAQDAWQVTPNLLMTLGLRDDTFTNYNPDGVPYVRMTSPNWEPRIGVSWDVFGDATLKLFGNAGRYYLDLPAAVALRGQAAKTTDTAAYFTYTGIDPVTGVPTGLQALPMNSGGHEAVGGGISSDNEYGLPIDPRLLISRNAKADYSDNAVLGALWEFTPGYVAGVTAVFQRQGETLQPWNDDQALCAAGRAQGFAYLTPEDCTSWAQGVMLFNPMESQTFLVRGPNGTLNTIHVSPEQQGFQRPPKRKYYSLDFNMEHAWDGKWFARADFIWSRSYGNNEGPVDSVIGQGRSSVDMTELWNFPQLMEASNGLQSNNHKYALKIYGAYAISAEWTVGGNLFIQTGAPKDCLGHYGPEETDPVGYGNAYHWCGGVPVPPGSTGRTPTLHQLAISVDYKPAFADHKLKLSAQIFNVFNEQRVLQYQPYYGTSQTPNPSYLLSSGTEPPRMVRFAVSYNW